MALNPPSVKKLGLITTSAFVIANMVGTGVFGSLGYQLAGTHNVIAVLTLWILGGVIALSGALVYSELGAAMPRSGGEYHYLSKIYHPLVGFLSGWVSITMGFAAPVAASAMLLGGYTSKILLSINAKLLALGVVFTITLIHAFDVKAGGKFQRVFTTFKILLILVFIVCGFLLPTTHQNLTESFKTLTMNDFFSGGFFVSLIYVTYAFSGWNASAYIASEIKDPQHNIPRSLLISTLLVTGLYFFLNLTFLLTAPVNELVGQKEVGYISASHIFGSRGSHLMAGLIAFLLISTISSMIFVGPRVSQVMGEDMKVFHYLSKKSQHGTPVYALFFQMTISFILIATSSFESVLTYTGFTLNLFTFLTVLGIFVHRIKFKNMERPYKTWGYPFVPIIYLLIIFVTIAYLVLDRPKESLLGFATVISGSIIYGVNQWLENRKKTA